MYDERSCSGIVEHENEIGSSLFSARSIRIPYEIAFFNKKHNFDAIFEIQTH